MSLHQTAGNQVVQQLYENGELQAKLRISQPRDLAEREAERVASEVIEPVGPTADTGTDLDVQRQASEARTISVDSRTEAQIDALRGGGRPLPETVRSAFEPRFGRDFSDVRVHTGPRADAAARSIDAAAFTLGTDIAFASGNYRPETASGERLFAHELAHVVQQTGASNDSTIRRQSSSQYERTGGLITFDPGTPGGQTFTSHSAAQARKLAVEAGVVEPLSESAERSDDSGIIELEETTITADMVIVVTADGEVKRLPRDEAVQLKEAANQRLQELLGEINAVAAAHRRYLMDKYGTDIDTTTLGGKWERGMGELAADISELTGGEREPPPLSIWGEPREYLREATGFIEGDVYDFHAVKTYAELARIDLKYASERWNSFVDNAIEGGEAALSTLKWTKSISKGIFSGLAAAYSGGGYAAIAYGTAGGGGIELATGTAQQTSAISVGYREEYDIAKLAGDTAKAMIVEAVAGLVAGPLLRKFASKWAVQLDAALREGSEAAGRAGQIYEFMEEYTTSVAKWYDTDTVSHKLLRRDVRKILDMDGSGIQAGLDMMNWAIENGYVQALVEVVVDTSYDSFVSGSVRTDDLIAKIMDGFFTTNLWKEMLVNVLEAKAK